MKRIHEYKRQLLNVLGIIWRYDQIKKMTPEQKAQVSSDPSSVAGLLVWPLYITGLEHPLLGSTATVIFYWEMMMPVTRHGLSKAEQKDVAARPHGKQITGKPSAVLPATNCHQYMMSDCFAPGTGGAEALCGGRQSGSRL